MQQNNEHSLYSNSCIELTIPYQYQQWGVINCRWSSQPLKPFQSSLGQFLLSQKPKPKQTEKTYYICSPLDIGCIISVKVQQQKTSQKSVLQHLRYGPVQIEQSLLKMVQNCQWKAVQLIFSKSVKKSASLSVIPQFEHGHNQNPLLSGIRIKFKVQKTQLSIYLSEGIAKNQLQSFQKWSFFKIFDSQPNSVGILIQFQIKQITERMKDLQINAHPSNYLKISFQNRCSRDIFILSVICNLHYGFESMKKFKRKIYELERLGQKAKEKEKEKDTLSPEIKNMPKQLLKIPKIQSTIRNSQITGQQFFNNSERDSDQPKMQQDILEDIYNILYKPINKTQRESFNGIYQLEEKSICINDISPIQNQRQNGQESNTHRDTFETINSNKAQNFMNQSQSIIIEEDKLNAQYKKLKVMPVLNFSKQISTPKFKIHNDQHSKNDETVRSNNKSDRRQKELLERIQTLEKINEHLVEENYKLRTQNQKLKINENKNDEKTKQMRKMIQIKQMVQQMAKKLQILEKTPQDSKQADASRSQKKRVQRTEKKQESAIKVNETDKQWKQNSKGFENVKRLWSPKAHQQLIKTFKQRNVDQKGKKTGAKEDGQRKKSASHFSNTETSKTGNFAHKDKDKEEVSKIHILPDLESEKNKTSLKTVPVAKKLSSQNSQKGIRGEDGIDISNQQTNRHSPNLASNYNQFRNVFGT